MRLSKLQLPDRDGARACRRIHSGNALAEEVRTAAYPEGFAQEVLWHNSKAVHRAYAKHAEVTVASLDDGEKEWQVEDGRKDAEQAAVLVLVY